MAVKRQRRSTSALFVIAVVFVVALLAITIMHFILNSPTATP